MEQLQELLRAEFDQLGKQVYNVGAVLKALAEQLRMQRDTNRKLEEQLQQQEAVMAKYSTHQKHLEHQLTCLEQLQKELEESQRQIAAERNVIVQLHERIRHLEQLVVQYEEQSKIHESLRAEFDALSQLYSQLTEDYRALQERVAKLSELERERTVLLERIAQFEHDHLRAIAATEEAAFLRSLNDQLQQQIAQQSARVTTLEEQLQSVTIQLESAKAQSTAYEQECQQLQNRISVVGAELEVLRKQISERDHEIEQLRQLVAELSSSNSDYSQHVLQQSVEQLQKEYSQLQQSHKHVQELLAQTERSEQHYREQLEQMTRLYNQASEEAQHYRTRCLELDHIIENAPPKISELALQEEIQRLQAELQLTEHAVQQRQQQLNELSDEVIRLRQAVKLHEQRELEVQQRIADSLAPYQIKLDAAESERKHMQEQLQLQRQRIVQLEEELRGELERNILLKRRIRQLEMKPSQAQIESLVQHTEHLRQFLHQHQGQLTTECAEQLAGAVHKLADLLSQWNCDNRSNLPIESELREALHRSVEILERSLTGQTPEGSP